MTTERERREYFDAKELDRLRAQALSHALTEYVPPGWLERSNPQQALLGPMLFPASEDGRQWQGVLAFRWDGAQSAILRWSRHEGESQASTMPWHTMIETCEIPVKDALALKEDLEALQPRGNRAPDLAPEAGEGRGRRVRLDGVELRRLEDQVFACAREEVQRYGLELREKWEWADSEDGNRIGKIEAYRLPGSDDVALFWSYDDWYNRIYAHHAGPNRIPREAFEELRAGLAGLWRVALTRKSAVR